MNFSPKFRLNYLLTGVITIAAIGAAVYFYLQYQNVQRQLTNPASFTQAANKDIIEKVGKLIELPEGETPTVATVTDPEKLKNQAFFTKAKNGDKVLIYTNARKAILYDPVANKIVDVTPVNIGSNNATPSATATLTKTPTPKPTKQISITP